MTGTRWSLPFLLAALAVLAPAPVPAADPPPDRPPEGAEASPPPAERVLEAHPVGEITESAPAPLPAQGGSDYEIGRQDLLEIRVFGLDELNQTVRVADDGSITLPLLGNLKVAGLTKSALEAKIASLLADRYVRNPQVIVFVKEHESKKVAVSGAVRNPGTYEMLGRRTLLEMISQAGGLNGEMGKRIIIFRRGVQGATHRISIDLERLVYAADPDLNVAILPGDIIYVPAIEKVRIFVSGAVRNPNLYEVPKAEPVTVLKAITIAGGTTDRAAEKRVQIIRTGDDGARSIVEVNLRAIKRGKAEDPLLEKDDVVFVPEAFF